MGAQSSIEWTDATWNPVTGCTRVSSGCDNCYAAALAVRLLRDNYLQRQPAVDNPKNRADPFSLRVWPERIQDPAGWSKPRMIFVNSMSDLFHVDVPEDFTKSVFEVMLTVRRHLYQVLTKRPARARQFFKRNPNLLPDGKLPKHIWIGTSVEDQSVAYRIRHLRSLPARVRFLSCEPLLGHIRLGLTGMHWVIVGGESGPTHRPIDLGWARSIRDQCLKANVPFFFKQVGGRTPKAGGRLLDGVAWDGVPFDITAWSGG